MICIYEGDGLERLSPLCDLRPAFDLRCGRYTLLEKFRRLYPDEQVLLWVREELQELTAEVHPRCAVNDRVDSDCLFLSAQAILDEIVPVRTDDAKDMARRLAREEALFAGTSSGANVVAAIPNVLLPIGLTALSPLASNCCSARRMNRIPSSPWNR